MALELKVGAFQPEFVGKMQFYPSTRIPKMTSRQPGGQRCAGRWLAGAKKPIGVATYRIVKQLPKALRVMIGRNYKVVELDVPREDLDRIRVTARLREVPWREALVTIATQAGLEITFSPAGMCASTN